MTQALQQATESSKALSEAQQNQIAMRLLEEIQNLKDKPVIQDEWDAQLERDVSAGLLDDLMADAFEEYVAGRVSKR